MKFINYLESITGIGIFPLLSLIIFVAFFSVVLLYVVKMDKSYIEKVSHIPLEASEKTTKTPMHQGTKIQ
jgi:hypothetical protein